MKANNMKNINNLQQRRGGFYWDGKEPYLSVTTILQCIDKPALRYWFGQEVYRAMLVDPSLSEKDALSAPYKTSSDAKARGTTVHSIVEAYKHTGETIDTIPEEYKGYAEAFYKFMKDHKDLEFIEQEKTIASLQYGIAGTLDAYCKLGDKHIILDVKTGKGIYEETGLQMSAYRFMMEEEKKQVDDIYCLLLETGKDGKPTGNYIFKSMEYDWTAFRAVKYLYCYLNREKLLKVNYKFI